jgi:hypothetical protein
MPSAAHLIKKTRKKETTRKPTITWKKNIKMGFKETGWKDVEWSRLA